MEKITIPAITPQQITAFKNKIRSFYRNNKRILPFRETNNPYAITVSEIMLQQTQVERVIPKYKQWLNQFPNWHVLSKASNRQLFTAWSGLGYNRRALYLKEMAKIIQKTYAGVMPDDPYLLKQLPGIGLYTAHAIAVFAFGKRLAAVDTNVRKVLIDAFNLPPETTLPAIQQVAEQILPRTKVREWHYALMDYANDPTVKKRLKQVMPLTRQSRFDGSDRQIRGEIIRQLTSKKQVAFTTVANQLGRTVDDVKKVAGQMTNEQLVTVKTNFIRLVD